MTPEQYWDGDNVLTKHYRKAHKLKLQQLNLGFWLQRMYVYEAICDASPILHDFTKRGTKPQPYASEPYPLTRKDISEHKEREEKLNAEKAKAHVAAWMVRTNERMKEKAGEEVAQDG